VTVDEAARRLSVGRTLLYGLIRAGKVCAIKLGTRTVIPTTEITRILSTDDRAA
jgi:excisionase family DNA binding protein